MLRSALVLALAVTAGHASGQSLESALPLDAADRRVLETRLSTILDFAAPGEVRRFELPSGRTAAVRPYLPVNRPGDEPCRGYRVDLFGAAGSVAVDGFRCRRADLNAWVIVEPEIVLAQDGAPLDLTGPAASDDAGATGVTTLDDSIAAPDDQPTVPAEPEPLFAEGEVPPVPRPAPREEAVARASPPLPARGDEEDTGAGTSVVARDVAAAPLAPLPATDDAQSPAAPPSDETVAAPASVPDPAGERQADEQPQPELAQEDDGPSPTDVAAATAEPVEAPQAAPPARAATERDGAATRIVGESEVVPDADPSADPRVVDALRDLAYLDDAAGSPSDARVRAAIDAFARDERFALPISPGALMERLSDALVRSSSLPACAGAPAGSLCVDGGG